MPNTNNARGLVPLRSVDSGYVNQGLETCYVAASDATALYIGDPVTLSGSADAAGVPGVTRAGINGPFKGVVCGFVPDGTTNMLGYRPASTAGYVLVHADQDALYEVQADTALSAADIGLNASLIAGSGSTYTKVSGFKLDASTKATTASLGCKIVGLSQRPNNDFGAYQKVLVRLNQHTDASASAGL